MQNKVTQTRPYLHMCTQTAENQKKNNVYYKVRYN